MPQPAEVRDQTTERLLALNVRLMQSLFEAGVVRIQFMKARDANVWPDMRRATQILVNAQQPKNRT